MQNVVDDVRGFNRFYTRVLGLLQPDLAGSAFGLTEARVLFELAHRDDVAVSELRRDLDLDPGYLSRILSGFTASGLVDREKSVADGRRHVVRLTDEGRRSTNSTGCRRARSTPCWRRSTRRTVRNSSHLCGGSAGRLATSPAESVWCSDRLRRAISGGWSSGVTPNARRRGSPSWKANGSAACSAWPPTTPRRSTQHSYGCCSSSRRRAEPVSGADSWTSACDSRVVPAIGESPCGPTTHCLAPVGPTSGPGSAATVASPTTASGTISSASTGHATSSVRTPAQRRAPAGCPASWPAVGHPSSPSCACRSAGS